MRRAVEQRMVVEGDMHGQEIRSSNHSKEWGLRLAKYCQGVESQMRIAREHKMMVSTGGYTLDRRSGLSTVTVGER